MGQINIINQYLNETTWMDGVDSPYFITNHVDVWKINVNCNLFFRDNFLSVMAPGEIERANHFLRTEDKNRSIISRGAVRIILAKYLNIRPAAIEFALDENQKPFINIKKNKGLHFNLSHSGEWVLLAVSNDEIGADIELINRQFKYKDILTDYFSEDEVNFIQRDLSGERFFLLWTRKEAFTKATGKGLDSPMKHIPSLNGQYVSPGNILSTNKDWLTTSFNLNSNYAASVTYNPQTTGLKFWHMDFKTV